MRTILGISFVLVACGGGGSDTQTAQTTPTASATTTTAPSGKADQCHAIATRVDAFTNDASKIDMHKIEGMGSLQTLSTQASTDLGAMKADAPLAGIVHESSEHLAEAAKIFAQLGEILGRIEAAKQKVAPDSLATIKTCVVEPVKAIATQCKAHPSADCTAVKSTLDAWGAADDQHQMSALAAVKALTVNEKSVKAQYAKVVICVQPLSDALSEIDHERAKLSGIGDVEDAREKKIDERFTAECGRKLFNNK